MDVKVLPVASPSAKVKYEIKLTKPLARAFIHVQLVPCACIKAGGRYSAGTCSYKLIIPLPIILNTHSQANDDRKWSKSHAG